MSLTTDMLNPQGRLGPKGFQTAGLILVAIGFVIGLISAVSLVLGGLLGILSLVLIYPWVVIWVKRLHDAGKSGWFVLLVILVWLIVAWIVSLIVNMIFAPAIPTTAPQDFSAMWSMVGASARAIAVPSAIATALVAVAFIFAGNAILKSEPGPNQYGAPTA